MATKLVLATYCLSILYISYFITEIESAGSCYYFSREEMDWFDALFACQTRKLCLADVATKTAVDDMESKLTKKQRKEYWFGLNGYEKFMFRYISNDKQMNYLPPHSTVTLEYPCGYLMTMKSSFTVRTGHCAESKKFICGEAERCNGVETNSTYVGGFNVKPSCEISEEIREMLGIDGFMSNEDDKKKT